VASVREVSADVRTYELVAPDAGQLPPWTPGTHIDVEIETGIVRHYSLCGDRAVASPEACRDVSGGALGHNRALKNSTGA